MSVLYLLHVSALVKPHHQATKNTQRTTIEHNPLKLHNIRIFPQ